MIDAQALTAALLLFAIVFAVYRITREEHRRQIAVNQEFKSARELQRLLIPEEQPLTPGYALTSSYKPASEVGGDFFQVVALENDSTLIVLGDVSGKGLKAAMAVSLIVGMIRALASIFPSRASCWRKSTNDWREGWMGHLPRRLHCIWTRRANAPWRARGICLPT